MAVVLSSSYGTLSREELRQTREDMAFISNYYRNMTETEKEEYRKNPDAARSRVFKLARKAREEKQKGAVKP